MAQGNNWTHTRKISLKNHGIILKIKLVFFILLIGLSLFITGCDTENDDGEENNETGEVVNDEDENQPSNDEETGENSDEEDEVDDAEAEEPQTLAEELGIEEIEETMYALVTIPYREDASHKAQVLGEIPVKDAVEVTGIVANGWIRIETENTAAYIHRAFLSKDEIKTATWGSGDMEEEMVILLNPEDMIAIVNKEIALAQDFQPEDLVQPDVPWAEVSNFRYMRQEAANALEDLFDHASEEGHTLLGRTGYRSFEAQENIFINFVNNHGYEEARTFSAKPGQSEHQTGLAMDITADSVQGRLTSDFGSTEEGQWVGENAHFHGYIIRYPREKEEVTGYIYEPWHLRYVGVDLATELYESGLTMEEYFGQVK